MPIDIQANTSCGLMFDWYVLGGASIRSQDVFGCLGIDET